MNEPKRPGIAPEFMSAFRTLRAVCDVWALANDDVPAHVRAGLLVEVAAIALADEWAVTRFGPHVAQEDREAMLDLVQREFCIAVQLSLKQPGQRPVEKLRAMIARQQESGALSTPEARGAEWALGKLDDLTQEMLA